MEGINNLMKKIVKAINKDIRSRMMPYGRVKTLASSKNLTIELVHLTAGNSEHIHEKSSKTYFIIKGTGELIINGQIHKVKSGDTFDVNKNTPHYWKEWKELEFLLIASPSIHPNDVIMVEK